MGFRDRFNIGLAAILLLFGVVATASATVSEAEITRIKAKIEAGGALSSAEITQVEEINATTSSRIDLVAAFDRARAHQAGDNFEGSHGGSGALDIWQAASTTFSWRDISTSGTDAGITGDDSVSAPITLGVPFRWFGTTPTSVRISTNGYLLFSGTANTSINTAIPDAAEPNNALYVFWDDLIVYPDSGDFVKYEARVDTFIVSWRVHRVGGTAPISFEAILRTGAGANGKVTYQYQSLDVRNLCTVGIEDPAGTYALQMCYNGTGSMPGATNSAYVLAEPAQMPQPVTALTATPLGTSTNVVVAWTNPTTDLYGTALTGGVDSTHIYLGTSLLARVYGATATYAHANTATGSLTYTVYAWNSGFQSYPTTVTTTVAAAVYDYVEDFEASGGGWTVVSNGWEWGVPTYAAGPQAHSGTKLWGTNLAGNYGNSACYQMELNLGQPVTSTGAGIAFWAWYKSEGGATTTYDGTNFRASTDGGSTWSVVMPLIGAYDDSLVTANNTCIRNTAIGGPYKSTWNGNRAVDSTSGITCTWRYFVIPLGQFNGQVPILRFVFGSDPAAANYPGFYFDDMKIWGIAPGAGFTVSGSVLLDGGAGTVTAAVVHASGLGQVTTNPVAGGAYSLLHVQGGNRAVWATLTGYQTAILPLTISADVTGANLTLRREAPVAPVIATSSITPAGVVTLDWDDSPDLLVDEYKIYSKLSTETTYTLRRVVYGRTNSTGTDTLTTPDTYHYVVTAVDTNVIAPAIESAHSNRVELMMGALPPLSLYGRGDWDDHVRLTWVKPGMPPLVEMSYDNGVNSPQVTGIGFTTTPNFGWFAARYQATGAVVVHRLRVYFTNAATVGDQFQVGLFANIGPSAQPRSVMTATMTTTGAFRDFVLAAPDTFASGIFYVGVRQMTANRIAIGGDMATPFVSNTFFYASTQFSWSSFDTSSTMIMAIPMMRAVVQSVTGAQVELAPAPVVIGGTAVEESAWATAISGLNMTKEEREAWEQAQIPVYLTPEAEQNVSQIIDARLSTLTDYREPFLEALAETQHGGSSALDAVDTFRVYRNGVIVGRTLGTVTAYDDYVAEVTGAGYTYSVTAYYSNGTESEPSNSVVATPRMAPAAPGTLTGTGNIADSTMHLTWADPTVNTDGSVCTDLTRVLIYRDGFLRDSVAAGVRAYTDHVLYPSLTYTWAVRAADEIRNLSPAVTLSAAAAPPWMPRAINWVDISESGTSAGLTGDDQLSGVISLGFTFPFYGVDYTTLKICTNGWLSFLNTTSTNLSNGAIPATTEPNAAIYPFWDDVDATGTGEWVKYLAEPERFIISWHEHLHSGGATFDFQVILESNGAITLQYLTLPATLNSYTVGVENATGTAAIMLYNNGAGLWAPTAGSAVRFFDFPLVYVSASGTVTLDGGAGRLDSVLVSVSGPNHPERYCDALGNFSFDSVAFGPRTFTVTQTGYAPTVRTVSVPLAGIDSVDMTLRRQAPPAPTNFAASIVSLTQVVTLHWTESTDALVDLYKLYRKLPSQSTLTLYKTISGLHTTGITDTLFGVIGGVQYALTAVDTNVIYPWVESGQVTSSVTGGHPGPTNLKANGTGSPPLPQYDNIIHLEWTDPRTVALLAAYYDNGSNSATVRGIGWWGQQPGAGWIATRFDMGAPATVKGVSAFFTRAATAGAPIQVAVFADVNGVPGNRPLETLDAMITEPLGTFQNFEFITPVEVGTGAFFVAVRQMTPQTLGLGGDETTPLIAGTFVHDRDGSGWEANEPEMTAIPLVRALLDAASFPELDDVAGAPVRTRMKAESFSKLYSPVRVAKTQKAAGRTMDKDAAEAVPLTSAAVMGMDVTQLQLERAQNAVAPHGPETGIISSTQLRHGGHTALDDIVHWNVYRDSVLIAMVPQSSTFYNDMNLPEWVNYSYYVTAVYDDSIESPSTNRLTNIHCAMSPAAPTELTLTAQGATMALAWYDPILNADGSPCNDLAMLYVERLLGTTVQMRDSVLPVTPGELNHYVDTPPVQTQLYTWRVKARDENFQNMGPYVSRTGIVEAPWHEVQYEWVNIAQTGTWLNGCGNDEGDDNNNGPVDIGFPFPYYGTDYTSLRICSNGWLSFTCAPTDVQWAETTLPTAAAPNGLIAPFWDDLKLDTTVAGGHWIKYQLTPAGFVVTWRLYKRSETVAQTFMMQVILEQNGGVRMQWESLPTNLTTFTTGVENQGGTQGITLNFDLADSTWRPRAHSAVRFWGGQSGSVGGVVTAQTGNVPIPNASVYATTDTSTSEIVHTDATGNYLLRLPPATYSVHFEHPAFCDEVRTVLIENNVATTQSVQMRAPVAQFNVTSFTLEAMEGYDTTATFTIRNQAGQCPLEFTISDTSDWLSVDPDTGVVAVNQTVTLTLHCDVDAYALHDHLQSAVVISYNAGTSPRTMQVDLDIVADTTDTSTVVDPLAALPTEFALKQNYPNPFNPTTELRFDVPRESFVKLVIYNIVGQEVATAVNSRMPAGRHRVTFDAGNLPTGMYLVRMDADGFSAVSKMMLLK